MQTLFGYLPVMEFCNKSSKRRCTRRDVQRALVHSRVSYRQPSRPHTCQHRLAGAHDHLLHMQQLLPHRPAAPRLPQCRDNSPELQHVHLGLKGAGGGGSSPSPLCDSREPLGNRSIALSASTTTACDSLCTY
jgi:hypothetical protein